MTLKWSSQLLALMLATCLWGGAPAEAKSKSTGLHASSHRSSSHVASSRTPRTGKLPPGTHFIRAKCKSAACKAKHPTGEYMLPIKPKKKS